MKEEELLDLCDSGVKRALAGGADQAEVIASFSAGSSVGFEKNDLQIASSDEEVTYGVRVIRGSAVGFATSNDPSTLAETVADALVIARASVPDKHNVLPEPRLLLPVRDLLDPSVTELSIESLTALGASLLERIKQKDARVSVDSGAVGAGFSRRAIVSSTGVRASEATTSLSGTVFGMAVDGDRVSSFIHEGEATRHAAGFAERLFAAADRFVEKATGALEARHGESFRGLVVFTPEAVESLLVENLLAMMSAAAMRKGKSLLIGKLGEAIAAPALTLTDDGTRDGALGSTSFDREGMPHQPLALIDQGVFRHVLYNHYEAHAAGHVSGSTGHAAGGASSLPGVGTTSLTLAPGFRPLAEILGGIDRAVMVTRFSGSTNAVTGEFSGVVKAGYLLEHGERRPVTETLIAGNLLDVFKNIVAVSAETERLFGRSLMPWVVADGISITAG